MRTYSRKPAVLIVLIALLCGGAYVYAARSRAVRGSDPTLVALEQTIAGQAAGGEVPTETWLAYAEKLRAVGRFDHAIDAYHRVLERAPDDRQGRMGLVLALAQANKADDLYSMLHDIVYGEPKLAQEMLSRKECKPYMSDDRFLALQKEARVQEMD